ncbi:MAG TPA: RluA family pseudouridine synthase [Anaeromyxobacteraceae bacterium]|nr:RluA family pseudouridine synthase [Anaeromyxobacteraceae bacterium]
MVEPLSLFVPREFAGERIDVVLPRLAKGLTRSRARRCLEEGLVEVNGRPVKPSLRVKGGEELLVRAWEPEPISLVAQDLPLAVLYEDRDLLVLDKAAGMVVHPARGSPHSTLVNALLYRLAGEGVAGGRLGLVHRLDRGTSGCLVVAKNEAALASLQASFKARAVEKTYLALCHGLLEPEGRLDTPYGRHPRDRTRYTSRLPSERRALTAWRVRELFPGATLAEVALHTGRTHQIRVHFAESGHPLLSDPVYGGTRREARLAPENPVRRAAEAIGRQALHALRLGFPHPRSGHGLLFEAPVPEDFARALAVLRAGGPSNQSR